MPDRTYPWIAVGLLALVASGVMAYYGAIVVGVYKEPLIARFRSYGDERRPAPLCRFLDALGWWSLLMTSLTDALVRSMASGLAAALPALFLVLMLFAFGTSLAARRRPELGQALPRWYADLVAITSREERRFIGYAWLRIPRRMRWRLSGDQAAFRTWADMVRISVIYGAELSPGVQGVRP